MKHILRTLAFYSACEGWHSYNVKCRCTVRAVRSLEKRGYLETNEFNQARKTGIVWGNKVIIKYKKQNYERRKLRGKR